MLGDEVATDLSPRSEALVDTGASSGAASAAGAGACMGSVNRAYHRIVSTDQHPPIATTHSNHP